MSKWIGAPNGFVTYTAEHWREREEETRTIAESMRNDNVRNTLMQIADGYRHLAEQTDTLASIGVPIGMKKAATPSRG